jgi:hypothetical protein
MKRILLGQLGVYGDCLFATTIARQIKHDNPDCILTWAIGSAYANILDRNPHVDIVWKYPVENRWEVTTKWYKFKDEANALKARGDFDEVYLTQAYPGNPENFYGSLRASMFRMYPHPIIVSLNPVLHLSPAEVERVKQFALQYKLSEYKNVILFEWTPHSGQSFITEKFAMTVARGIVGLFPDDTCVILCGNKKPLKIDYDDTGFFKVPIFDASVLSFREIAELTNYCTLFLGTGSGITQVCSTQWAKPLPIIQLLKQGTVASIISDHNYFKLYSGNVVEMTECSEEHVIEYVRVAFTDGISTARNQFCEDIIPDFINIRFHMMFESAILKGRYLDIIPALTKTVSDYGMKRELIGFFLTFPKNFVKFISYKIRGLK